MNRRQSGFQAISLSVIVLIAVLSATETHAAFVMTLTQSGSSVVATGSGTINTTALTVNGTVFNYAYVIPSQAQASLGPNGNTFSATETILAGITGPGNFGTAGQVYATSGSGNGIAIDGHDGFLLVPSGYVSGATLSDTATFAGATISSLGITPGTYTWNWGSGASADSFTMTSAVPEPSLLGVGGFALLLRRRQPA
jgi:hypothetical protein